MRSKGLGDSIEKIAFEKAGIIKENTPLVIGKLPKKAKKVIADKCVEKSAPVFELNRDFFVDDITISLNGTTFDYKSSHLQLKKININLLGKHQAENAAIAIKSFELFAEKLNFNLNINKIKESLNKVLWPGRMQILHHNPLVIIDGAHNEEGIEILTKNLKNLFPKRRIFTVLAILRDKNLKSIIRNICDFSYKIFVAKNKSARAAELSEQIEYIKLNNKNYVASKSVSEAVTKLLKEVDINDIIIVTGSLYTISEILEKKDLFA